MSEVCFPSFGASEVLSCRQEMAPEMSGTFSELPELPGMAMAMSGGLTVAAAEALGSHGQVVAASSDSVQHPAAMGAAEPVG